MKLAEALLLRADYQKRIEQLKLRLNNNILIQEGDKLNEDPDVLIAQLLKLFEQKEELIKKINKTNNETLLDLKLTLADALTLRESLLEKRAVLANVVEAASVRVDRYSQSEIKYVTKINVQELVKQMDDLSAQYRKLDTLIQQKNWNTDLI